MLARLTLPTRSAARLGALAVMAAAGLALGTWKTSGGHGGLAEHVTAGHTATTAALEPEGTSRVSPPAPLLPEVVFHHHPSAQRNVVARRTRESRNRVWAAWIRRSARDAVRTTVMELRAAARTGTALALIGAVARGLPMLVTERRRVTPATEQLLRTLER